MSPLLLQTITSFVVTLVMITLLARVAPKLGLMDIPSGRKSHKAATPLVGGLAIFTSLVFGALVWGNSVQTIIQVNGNGAISVLMLASAVLVISGALDDLLDFRVFVRVLSEVAVGLIVIEGLELRVGNLGNLFGFGDITLSRALAYPFTVIAIFGIINAFNMLDGLDGLLGGLVLITLGAFHLFTGLVPGFVTLYVGAAIFAFLVSNLSLTNFIPKVFLGDAGSRLLGLVMVTLILAAASEQMGGKQLIEPVTALFIVGLPLYDMTLTTIRRVLRGKSPLSGDRTHIHHLMLALGFSQRRSLALVLSVGASLPSLGLILARGGVSAPLQTLTFVGAFLIYSWFVIHGWKIAGRLKELQDSIDRNNALMNSSVSVLEPGKQKNTA